MTMCSTYVGEMNSPGFSWDSGDYDGNIPQRISPYFPRPGGHHSALTGWVKVSGAECKQTDFDAWAAKVTKSQLRGYLHHCCGDDISKEHIEYVDSLVDGKVYVLVSECF